MTDDTIRICTKMSRRSINLRLRDCRGRTDLASWTWVQRVQRLIELTRGEHKHNHQHEERRHVCVSHVCELPNSMDQHAAAPASSVECGLPILSLKLARSSDKWSSDAPVDSQQVVIDTTMNISADPTDGVAAVTSVSAGGDSCSGNGHADIEQPITSPLWLNSSSLLSSQRLRVFRM